MASRTGAQPCLIVCYTSSRIARLRGPTFECREQPEWFDTTMHECDNYFKTRTGDEPDRAGEVAEWLWLQQSRVLTIHLASPAGRWEQVRNQGNTVPARIIRNFIT